MSIKVSTKKALRIPTISAGTSVLVRHALLKYGCIVEANEAEVLTVQGSLLGRTTSGEEEVLLKNSHGDRVGIANVSAVSSPI